MHRFPLVILIVAACEQQHDIQLLLGPTSDTLSQGFLCVQDADPTKLLASKAKVVNGLAIINLVVDVIGFGGAFPGCRGEEIVALCSHASCDVIAAPDGSDRFCLQFQVPPAELGDIAALKNDLRGQLKGKVVMHDTPDIPVIIRAVATSQDCSQISTPSNGTYPALDPNLALGCAYSCPALLDEIDGPVALSFDALDDHCEQAVRVCARFPAN